MKTAKSSTKKTPAPAKPGKKENTNPDNTIRGMTIEEAREAEKAFNEELEIFREAAKMNRTKTGR